MLNIIIPAICLLIGSIATWHVLRNLFEKNHVSVAKFNEMNQQLITAQTEKRMIEKSLSEVRSDYDNLKLSCDGKQDEVTRVTALLSQRSAEKDHFEQTLLECQSTLDVEIQSKKKLSDDLAAAREQLIQANAEVENCKQKLSTQKEEVEQIGKKFEDAFKVLAQNILDDKSKKFSLEQEKNLKGILEPLQKEIQQFKDDVGAKQKQESDERTSLREQVKLMAGLNQTLSDQANKLTETLRLQVKQQGDWGESILEAILENSGLQKDLQYKTQYSTRNDDGKIIRPDVVVNYPDGRKIIIDSKVSLVSYYNMCSSQNKEEELNCLKELIKSVKSHIDGLASKNYGDINQALDFIIMFVPVEPAYIAAMHGDSDLWQYAYKRGILLISPANLIATLKLVKDMWRKDAVDKNAHEIAEKAGKLYDKLVAFVDNFQKVGLHLDKAKETWTDAFGQLKEGKGNALSWGLKLKALNIQSKKDLPDDLANAAILNDHFGVEKQASNDIQLYE
jgi:DNA recombination protein RmuC